MRFILLSLLLLSTTVHGVSFTSGEEQTPTIELFTSQGCSSCPPADRWLSKLVDHPGLWKEVIPMAFHVDYWDYIGWKDRFAHPRHTLRQQLYRHWGSLRSVYTPGFVVKGSEWRGFFHGDKANFKPGRKVGRLSLEYTQQQPAKVNFSAVDDFIPQQLKLNLVLLGFDLQTPVKAGENHGKNLAEDFIVLGWNHKAVNLSDKTWSIDLPKVKDAKPKHVALVAWISGRGSPAPLQAVGGWIPNPL